MNLILILTALLVAVGLIFWWQLSKAHREIEQLMQTNAQLEQQKAVAETQVTHYQTRQKNEENHRATRREHIIDSLQQSGDLRD